MFRSSSGKVVFAATGLMLCTLVRAGPTTRPDSAAAARQAQEYYRNVERAYMEGRWKELSAALRVSGRYNARLTRQQRANLAYIRRTAAEFRPPWWQATKSTSNRSFRAQIWKRWFVANYVPSELMGLQAPVGARHGKLVVIVSWRPSLVDNPRPLGGVLAKRLGLRKGDLGEVVVWHELGHNYVNSFLPIRHVMALYRHHSLLYRTLQEFYADLTAVYHSSPHARRAALLLRLDEIESNRESEPHTRAALGVGSLLLSGSSAGCWGDSAWAVEPSSESLGFESAPFFFPKSLSNRPTATPPSVRSPSVCEQTIVAFAQRLFIPFSFACGFESSFVISESWLSAGLGMEVLGICLYGRLRRNFIGNGTNENDSSAGRPTDQSDRPCQLSYRWGQLVSGVFREYETRQ